MKNLLKALRFGLLADLGYSLFEDADGFLSLYKKPLKSPLLVTDDPDMMVGCLSDMMGTAIIGHA